MPIVRTYRCDTCGYHMTKTLRADQWQEESPECPQCARMLGQEFHPPAIVDSADGYREKARKLAYKIAEEDMGVADLHVEGRRGAPNKVRYKDSNVANPSQWVAASQQLMQGVAAGSRTRAEGYDGIKDYHRNIPKIVRR